RWRAGRRRQDNPRDFSEARFCRGDPPQGKTLLFPGPGFQSPPRSIHQSESGTRPRGLCPRKAAERSANQRTGRWPVPRGRKYASHCPLKLEPLTTLVSYLLNLSEDGCQPKIGTLSLFRSRTSAQGDDVRTHAFRLMLLVLAFRTIIAGSV